MPSKTYDQAYFDKWYRDPAHAVASPAELRRKVAMVVAQAEFYLGRPLRTVLDVGCGEGRWRAPLRKLRPQIAYRGLDASPYVVMRYGSSRHIGLARFAQLGQLRFEHRFDLIVCSDVLHYLGAAEIREGLAGFGDLLEGLAFLEVYTSRDDVAGDRQGFKARTPAWYLQAFGEAGLMACGSHGYLSPRLMRKVAALECPAQIRPGRISRSTG